MRKELLLKGNDAEAAAIRQRFEKKGYSALDRYHLAGDLKMLKQGKYVQPVQIAENYSRLGDKAQALRWLEAGYQNHDSSMVFLPVSTAFDPIRNDLQFQQLMGKLGLKP
jgi:hypothetical protein